MTIKKCEKLGTVKVRMVLIFMGLEKQMWKAFGVVIRFCFLIWTIVIQLFAL